MTKHTFIICAYGNSPYLEDCILSLKKQTLQTRIVLYTSTPSDYIAHLCQQYDIPLVSATGGGIGKDWNNALSFVKTDFVTIAHQDDIYQPDYAREILARMTDQTTIAFSDYEELQDQTVRPANTNLKIKRLMLATLNLFSGWAFWRGRVLAFGNPISCPAVTYNLKRLSGFAFSETMRVSLDWYAWYQINRYKGRFVYVAKPLMLHRIHEESETSHTISDNTRTKEDLEMFRLFWPRPLAHLLNRFYIKSQDSNH